MQTKLINVGSITDKVNFYDLALLFEEQNLKTSYNNVIMLCPFHEEKTASFSYNIEKKFYYCFGCSAKGDIVDYVKHKMTCSFKEACSFLCKFAGIDENNLEEKPEIPSYRKELSILKKGQEKKIESFDAMNEQQIEAMVEFRGDFFKDRGFTKETLDYFQVGFDIKEKRVVVPIRNEQGILVGVTGRTIYSDYKDRLDSLGNKVPKWKHYKLSNISENFFNIENGIKYSKEQKHSIIICEGPSDAMMLHQLGFKNVIACLTNSIKNVQKGILLKNFLNIYLFLDGDLGGENGKSSIYEAIKGYFTIYNVECLQGKDPDQMTKEEIELALKNARKI